MMDTYRRMFRSLIKSEYLNVVERDFDKDEWLGRVQREVDIEMTNQRRPSIFSVPQALINDDPEIYAPQLVSLGPYHFGKPELNAMESYKSEAARRIQSRMQGVKKFSLIVEELRRREGEIRDCYDRHFEYDGEVLAWMMARDASFLLEFLRFHTGYKYKHPDSSYFHHIFGRNCSSEKCGILKDVAKADNQVPYFVLEEVLAKELGSRENAKELLKNLMTKFYSAEVLRVPRFCIPSAPAHLIQIMYHNAVSSQVESSTGRNRVLALVSKCFHWTLKRFHSNKAEEETDAGEVLKMLSPRLPPAVELNRKGVQFKSIQGGIIQIRFHQKSCTLYLPTIDVEIATEIFIRNLIAFEGCFPSAIEEGLPFTMFFRLMDELVDDEKDVALLRKHGVITIWSGSDRQIADLFNSVTRLTWVTTCQSIDAARKGLQKHLNRKWKTLIYEFWNVNCSKPWLVISGFAAAALMVMTLLQVACLFTT